MRAEECRTFEDRVGWFIRCSCPLPKGTGVAVSLSGGADSTALLLVLEALAERMDFRLEAWHLNHGLRGADSDGDESFCRDLAGRLGVPCHVRRLDPPEAPGGNLEERLRLRRREFWREALQGGCSVVALGHTRDDRAETLLLRLARGAGLEGLGCLPPQSGPLVRPLLTMAREDILAYLKARGESWREDSSNSDFQFDRNRVRHRVLPLLARELNPAIRAVLARTAETLEAEGRALRAVAGREADRLGWLQPEGWEMDRALFLGVCLDFRLPVLREGLRRARGHLRGLERRDYERLLGMVTGGGEGERLDLPGRFWAQISRGRVLLASRPPGPGVEMSVLSVPGTLMLAATGDRFEVSRATLPREGDPREGAAFHAREGDILEIRAPRPGDKIRFAFGRKRLSDLLSEKGIPLYRRSGLQVVALPGGEVIWLPDLGIRLCYNRSNDSGSETFYVRRIHERGTEQTGRMEDRGADPEPYQ